jgi:hypothetical protein
MTVTGMTRTQLAADALFDELLRRARQRVALMEARFVAIDDAELRTVFEVYAAVALGTQDFDSSETH